METTLEIRWFVPGIPPAVVQRWYRFECPGNLLEDEPETRQDVYVYPTSRETDKLSAIAPQVARDLTAINLKLREGNLELKLRQHRWVNKQFGHVKHSAIATWTGNIEQWHKLTEEELRISDLSVPNLVSKTNWISVYKQRVQKVDRDVKSELTWLEINGCCWWSVAFEMTKNCNDRQQDRCFETAIARSCQTYYGPKLSADNSYGYARWLQELQPQTIFDNQLEVNKL